MYADILIFGQFLQIYANVALNGKREIINNNVCRYFNFCQFLPIFA